MAQTSQAVCVKREEMLMFFIPVGDHTLVMGRVTAGDVFRSAEALTSTYTGWPYSG